ncbi:Histidine kinase [Sphingomonas sp. EC-HK361]|uniref:sensor histidine kinase n=1 Tax=Sphingomonas sp. EC-HK361 TaxID=2038397 RepID=UPI001253C791|nr:HAMP domain-containing sensor histidine kinase [Sphingomonas sp. EC-HK361]VVT07883.1 Histidine kinase [Sphingomonas sp. EC-HK361]
MRLIPRSIHGRLLALSFVATLLALALAGAAIAGVMERFVMQGLDQRLDAQLALLATVIDGDGHIDKSRIGRVRGLIEDGPDWEWRIAGPDGVMGTGDLPALVQPPGPPPGPGPRAVDERPHPGDVRDARGKPLHTRQAIIQTTRGAVTLTAGAPAEIIARPVRAAVVPLLTILAVLGLALGVAAVVQLRLGLRPLRRLRGEVAAVRTGQMDAVSAEQPTELVPLIDELNALIRDNAASLATARASAANLAHALKTPVATLALELRDDPSRAAQVDRIYRTIRHHLARARAGSLNTRSATALLPVVDDLVATIARIHVNRSVDIVCTIPDDLAAAIDPADLSELAGNLIDNAARHARKRVEISAATSGRQIRLAIADDGAGMSAPDRTRALQPGVRLDERGDGDGFGLSIAQEIADLHGGSLALGTSDLGGLLVTVALPAALRTG